MDYFLYGFAFLVISFLLYSFLKKKSSSFPELLLFGPPGGGKTRLFYKLTEDLNLNTVTSMKPNICTFQYKSKSITLTDYPGHHYYYQQLLSKAPKSIGMIFLLDSTDKSSFKVAAEELYELMALRCPKEILIFCNKQDLPFAKRIMMIESELSTEIERLKVVKENDIAEIKRGKVGKAGQRFEFAQMIELGVRVEFVEGSIEKGQIEGVMQFIERVVN